MSKLELIRSLFGYNEYADEYLLDETAKLSPDEFSKDRGASWGSIKANLVHITDAQKVWLSRWDEAREPVTLREDMDIGGHAAVRGAFAESHGGLRAFVERVSEERVNGIIEYEDNDGTARRLPLWLLMVHLMNHGTHHRSEVCMALTAMGREVKELDYHYFEMERMK